MKLLFVAAALAAVVSGAPTAAPDFLKDQPNAQCSSTKQPLPFASIASQKRHIGLYLFCVYADDELKGRFVSEWKETGKRLDMGKSCVRVKDLDSIPLEVIGRAFKRSTAKKFVKAYEASIKR